MKKLMIAVAAAVLAVAAQAGECTVGWKTTSPGLQNDYMKNDYATGKYTVSNLVDHTVYLLTAKNGSGNYGNDASGAKALFNALRNGEMTVADVKASAFFSAQTDENGIFDTVTTTIMLTSNTNFYMCAFSDDENYVYFSSADNAGGSGATSKNLYWTFAHSYMGDKGVPGGNVEKSTQSGWYKITANPRYVKWSVTGTENPGTGLKDPTLTETLKGHTVYLLGARNGSGDFGKVGDDGANEIYDMMKNGELTVDEIANLAAGSARTTEKGFVDETLVQLGDTGNVTNVYMVALSPDDAYVYFGKAKVVYPTREGAAAKFNAQFIAKTWDEKTKIDWSGWYVTPEAARPKAKLLVTDTGSKMDGYPFFDQTYKFATNGADGASSKYWGWAANFFVSFSKMIPAKTLKLATRYEYKTEEWDQSIKGDPLKADVEYELSKAGTYGDLCTAKTLDFGVWAYDNRNTGTTMTVWFKLTNGAETVKQKLAEYTFPELVKVVIRPSGVTEETAPYAVETAPGYYTITNYSCEVTDTVLTMTGLKGGETVQLNYLCNFVSNANANTKFNVMSYPKKTTKGAYRYLPVVIPDSMTVCKGYDPKTGVFNTALSTNAMAYPVSVLNETNKFTSWWKTFPMLSYVVMRCTNIVEQDWTTVSSIEYRTESYETHFFETKGSGEKYRPDSFYKVQVAK